MSRRVLVAPDKFKGTLSARAAAEAIARGWQRAWPEDAVELLPISDGGDGFGELLGQILNAQPQSVRTVDAAHRPCETVWWWMRETRTAIVEAARVNGLAQLPPGWFHPFDLDTFGLGAVFGAAAAHGARRCLVGIGGSATNDGGFGLARALGWGFFDAQGRSLERWTELSALERLARPPRPPSFEQVLVAVDVQNRLLGPTGCTRVYGPQKGLRVEDFEAAERCLGRLAEVVHRQLGFDAANEPGAGAAGGLGFGLRSFLGARLEPGFGVFAQHARLRERLASVHLVITGEGAMDASTLMGKGVGELAALCQRMGLPCVGLAGVVTERANVARVFAQVSSMVPDLTSREQALSEPALWLERLAERTARDWSPGRVEGGSDRPQC